MIYIYCDGASKGNPGPASIGVSARKSPSNSEEIFTISEAIGNTTNNIAEWTSLIRAIEKALEGGNKKISVFMDSELVVKQVKGEYKVKHPGLIPFKNKFTELRMKLEEFQIEHVYRTANKRADELANKALS